MPGDPVFTLDGILPYLYIAFLGLRNWRRGRTADTFTKGALYEETQGGRKARRGERVGPNGRWTHPT